MRAVLAWTLLITAGCDVETVVIDKYPVDLDMTTGAPHAHVTTGEEAPVPVVLDTGSAVTILEGADQTIQSAVLTLHGETAAGPVPRARWLSVPVLYLPGEDGDPAADGVIGGDVLAQVASRWDLGRGTVNFFPGLPIDDDTYEELGGAVLDVRRAGGGNYLLGDREVTVQPSRLPIDICLDQRVLARSSTPQGDALLLFATGVERTVLSEAAYLRALSSVDPDAAVTWTYDDELWLPGAREATPAYFTSLGRLSLVGDEDDNRGPCRELWANRTMRAGGCTSTILCACEESLTCDTAAAVELERPLQIAVIRSDDPYLARLREELRPAYADVDGLLGADALKSMIVDADLPGSRMIFTCTAPDQGCTAFRRFQSDSPGLLP